MTTTATPPQPAPAGQPGTTRPRGAFWAPVLLAGAGWLALVMVLQARNPRLVPSWHGFLHSAIVERFPASGLVPENPFYAGEGLHYYWFYHWIGAGLARALNLDPLTALRWLSLGALVLLVLGAALIGRRIYRSTWAGLAIGLFAIAGMNPLGPVIAAGRHFIQHRPLAEWHGARAPVETVFVSDALADTLMSRPALPAMYLGADWRNGQNLVWFFDISSRALGLAALVLLLALLVRPEPGAGGLAALAGATALTTALNPIVGLAGAGLLGASLLALGWRFHRPAPASRAMPREALWKTAALAAGVLGALPTYMVLLRHSGGAGGLSNPAQVQLKILALGAGALVLVPLALLGARATRNASSLSVHAVALAGLGLLAAAVAIHLEKGNEHNLVNAAAVLLAVPAAGWLVQRLDGSSRPPAVGRRRVLLAALLFLPVTAGTWWSFDGRPGLPLRTAGGRLLREPPGHPLARFYDWTVRHTDPHAVFLVDPSQPVKMSGNVMELPAFTGREIYVGQLNYMSSSYPDVRARMQLARKAEAGFPLDERDLAGLRRLGRPVYLVSYRATDPALAGQLRAAYGAPVFADGFVAVFSVVQSLAGH